MGGALKTAAFRGDRWCLQRLMDGSDADELLAAAFAAAAAGQAFKGGTWESGGEVWKVGVGYGSVSQENIALVTSLMILLFFFIAYLCR